MKRIKTCLAGIASVFILTSCTAKATYEGFTIPDQGGSTLTPAAEYSRNLDLDDACPEEPTLSEYSSEDGLCVIEKKEHYYAVTLDLEKGDHYKAGAAYAEAILKAVPDYGESFEPYLFENITMMFSEADEESYKSLTKRVTTLKDSLEDEYRLEAEGFADRISGDVHGFSKDGIISYEEALTLQMVPDALRGTSCSAVSLDGSRTVSGKRISARILEWMMGSSDQLAEIQAVTRFKNGNRSITTVSSLGLLDVISGFTDNGVLAGILDVGGTNQCEYTYEGKTCYTFALRHALENSVNARDVAEYMLAGSDKFTYSHNIYVTDEKDAFCVENSANELIGKAKIRTETTPLRPDYGNVPDGAFFVVNCYVSEGSPDKNAFDLRNLIRWRKLSEWFDGDEKFTSGSFRSRLASETKENYDRDLPVEGADADAFHVLVIDYSTGETDVSFYRPDDEAGVPEYIKIAEIKR